MGTRPSFFAGITIAMTVVVLTHPQGFPQAQGRAAAAMAGRIHRSTDAYDRHFNGRKDDNYEDMDTVPSRALSTSIHASTGADPEVQVLMAFKQAVTHDSLGALNSWNSNDSDPCHWKGVTCSQRSNTVTSLALGNLALEGTISPLLGSLRYLQKLDLSNNFFNNEIPASLGNCSHLSYLALRNNNLTGHIPSQLGNLPHLRFLDLGMNFFLGGLIPTSLVNCSVLTLIHLDYTVIRGEIPPSLGQLAYLKSLNLSNTFNSGSVPKSLGNCSSLAHLVVGNLYNTFGFNLFYPTVPFVGTKLDGVLPEELGKLKRLKTLGVGGTLIKGPFPAWIENLTELARLGLEDSLFSGEIPVFLGNLPLEILGLRENNFSGPVPAAISNCSNLWWFDMGGNPHLGGNIPPELGKMTRVVAMYFDNGRHTGKIPSSLANCSALQSLDLAFNPLLDPQPLPSWVGSLVNLKVLVLDEMNLLGEIPVTLGQLYKLELLSITLNQLTGVIPASLGNCTALLQLDVASNRLHGELPSEIWKFSQINFLHVGTNSLTGILPVSIGNLSMLQSFDCSGNLFDGEIPSQLGSLQSLQDANFDDNNFDGFIPHLLGNCSALLALHMSGNQLSGPIPASLGNLTNLGGLFLSKNQLQGVIPVDLMRSTGLLDLDLSENLLVGNIPQEIGQLVFLQGLHLQHNKLSAALPHSLSFLSSLIYVDLSYNAFGGAIPREVIPNISATLNSLNLSHNLLYGSLPQELAKLTFVYYLDFSFNNLSGSIPSGLGECRSLERLDLSVNNFSGSIPPALGQLGDLIFVNLSFNHLEGALPDGGIFNSTQSNMTSASFLGNSGLCGSPVLIDCPAGPSALHASSCKGFRCAHTRTVVACIGATVGLVAFGVLISGYWLLYKGNTDKEQSVVKIMGFAEGLKLSEQELLAIIAIPGNMIGVGTSSTIYKGALEGGRTIALKVLTFLGQATDDDYKQAEADLYREAHTLAKLKHRNILKVLGMFSTQKITALILEFMPKASLHQQLYDVGMEEDELTWETRLNIALGVAQGLVYLHTHAREPVIHRDLKPSNVLLDADLNPKLCDFGISKFVKPNNLNGETTASKIRGTIGYFPPEYAATAAVSTKGDVYSYGVILLELLTRKQPTIESTNTSTSIGFRQQRATKHIVDWVLESYHEDPLAVLDPTLFRTNSCTTTNYSDKSDNHKEQMKLVMQVGLLCTQSDPQSRPHMSDVLAMLRQIEEKGQDHVNYPSLVELAEHDTILHTQVANVNTVANVDSSSI